jgi:ADP-heptose:LPS heptosyltransferase
VQLFSLQFGPPTEQIAPLQDTFPLIDACSNSKDLTETAALIATLDLVITVDTSIAHLSGAMGVPVWLMLAHLSDWRWFEEREDCPWYPSARLFRQPSPGDWNSLVQQVRDALTFLAEQRAGK